MKLGHWDKEKEEPVIEKPEAIIVAICGGPADHEHDDEGSVLFWDDGSVTPDTEEFRNKGREIGLRNTGGSVACSICGSTAFDRHASTGFDDGWEGD